MMFQDTIGKDWKLHAGVLLNQSWEDGMRFKTQPIQSMGGGRWSYLNITPRAGLFSSKDGGTASPWGYMAFQILKLHGKIWQMMLPPTPALIKSTLTGEILKRDKAMCIPSESRELCAIPGRKYCLDHDHVENWPS